MLKSMAAAPEVLPPLLPVAVAPPNPEYTVPPPEAVDTADAPPPAVPVAVFVEIVLVFTLVGLRAPQG
jgi:hypothetical protein